ncbi:MAG TPA: hypothetical protein VE400_03825, partial [Mycobacterium sp.]|nr:hypothetical protein [Mycobacterium sp.]
MPPLVFVSSPQGAHDVLARTDAFAERAATPMSLGIRQLLGDNLLVVPYREGLPRRRALQPLFAKQHVPQFAGHMPDVAEQLADRWAMGAAVDLDVECRALTLANASSIEPEVPLRCLLPLLPSRRYRWPASNSPKTSAMSFAT